MDENIDLSKNIEIEKALKEFEEKSGTEQKQPTSPISKNLEPPKMVQWVIKISGGSIKNEKQAQYILLGFAILSIIVSLFLFLGGGSRSKKIPPMTPEQRSFMETGHGL